MTEPTYLPDDEYDKLIDELIVASQPIDLRDRIMTTVGEAANIWPSSIKPDEEN